MVVFDSAIPPARGYEIRVIVEVKELLGAVYTQATFSGNAEKQEKDGSVEAAANLVRAVRVG